MRPSVRPSAAPSLPAITPFPAPGGWQGGLRRGAEGSRYPWLPAPAGRPAAILPSLPFPLPSLPSPASPPGGEVGALPIQAFSVSSSGISKQSHSLHKQSFQIHKIHRIFHKWMNTIFYQFPHYANMQNIKFRPIRVLHSPKFTRLSHNCRNYQIITVANWKYLWQIQQILAQITFHSRNHCAPLKFYRSLI